MTKKELNKEVYSTQITEKETDKERIVHIQTEYVNIIISSKFETDSIDHLKEIAENFIDKTKINKFRKDIT